MASLLDQHASAHPADNDLIIVFIVGGVTGCELEQASAALTELYTRCGAGSKEGRALQGKTVYIGSTHWLQAETAASELVGVNCR